MELTPCLLHKATSPRLGNVTNLSNIQKQKQQIIQNEASDAYVPNKQTKKKQDKIPEELSEVQISNLPNKEFKVMIIKMFKELGRRIDKKSEKS